MCILTQEVTLIDAIKLKDDICPICLKKSKVYSTYWGTVYKPCKHETYDEMWRGDLVRMRREFLKLTRRQMGELVNRSKHTIKGYEWTKCPDWYFKKTEEFINSIL